MNQAYRDQYAHYIDTTPGEEATYVREGVGVEALAIDYNPQVDQYKTIIQRTADATFNNYQPSFDVSEKRIYRDDPLYKFLNEARLNAKAIETTYIEVDMGELVGAQEGKYKATKYDVLIVISSALGENATISYTTYFKSEPKNGSVTIADGKPTFTEAVD